MSDLLDAALAYAAQGIPIFPCVPGTKRPLTPRGFHDATTNELTIRRWWIENPDANIAFSPHTVGQGVVDLDPPDGEEAWIAFAGGLEPTWTVRTPRGGLHLYFRGELPTSVRKLIPGKPVDTRGRGSYALLPPSRTPDGAYVLVDDTPPAPVPYLLAERVLAMKTAPTVTAKLDDLDKPADIDQACTFIAAREPAVEGQGGDQWTYQTIAKVRDCGLSEDMTFTVIQSWNDRCLPPWGDYELMQKVENVYRYATNPEPGAAVIDRTPMLAGKVEPPPPIFKLRHPGEWSTLKRAPSLIAGMLPAQGTGVLYAPPGSFKSFIALGLAFAVATGKPAFGQYAASRTAPVVYCAGEGHLAVAAERLPALFGKHEVAMTEATPLYLMNGVPLAIEPGTAADFLASIRSQIPEAPALVVIDTMARSLAGLNENDASEAGRFVTLLETVASELGCFVLAVGHEGKDSSKGVRGSSAVQAGVDVIWQAQRPTETSQGVSLHCRKDKDGDAHEIIYLMGAKFGGSVVFSDMPEAEWQKACGAASGITPSDVGKALDFLGGRNGVSIENRILAEHLAGPSASENLIEKKEKALLRGVWKGPKKEGRPGLLHTYVTHHATGTRDPSLWSIPSMG